MTHLCHICLLPIPPSIVTPKHPLFGTKDHVVPKCAGGTNAKANLAPAHYYCNRKKGNGVVTHELMLHCSNTIYRELGRAGIKLKLINPIHFNHLHAMIEYLCVQVVNLEDEMEKMYRERGFAR